jgi:DNA-binding transcriptional LysR family regulator
VAALVFDYYWLLRSVLRAKRHPLAREKSVKLSELAGEKFISFERDIPTRKAIDKILKDRGVAVETVMECDNIETIKRIVEIEAGVSIVPHATITQEVAQKTLAQVKIEGRNLYQPVAAIYKKNKALTPAMKKFLAMLKS